jgi:hypothetical protein
VRCLRTVFFVKRGIETRRKLIDWSAKNALLPAREYWTTSGRRPLLWPLAVAGVEPDARRLKGAPSAISAQAGTRASSLATVLPRPKDHAIVDYGAWCAYPACAASRPPRLSGTAP